MLPDERWGGGGPWRGCFLITSIASLTISSRLRRSLGARTALTPQRDDPCPLRRRMDDALDLRSKRRKRFGPLLKVIVLVVGLPDQPSLELVAQALLRAIVRHARPSEECPGGSSQIMDAPAGRARDSVEQVLALGVEPERAT